MRFASGRRPKANQHKSYYTNNLHVLGHKYAALVILIPIVAELARFRGSPVHRLFFIPKLFALVIVETGTNYTITHTTHVSYQAKKRS